VTPIERLRTVKKTLPPKLRQQILDECPALVPDLIAVMEDEALSLEESPAEGWPPMHAVDLLVDAKAEGAIVPMLDNLAEGDFDAVVHDRIVTRLPELGAAVLEPALRYYDEADEGDDLDLMCSILSVLAKLGVQDPRILTRLESYFDEDPSYGAILLFDYGDVSTLPLLVKELETCEPDFSDEQWRADVTNIAYAIEAFGGDTAFIEAQRRRLDVAFAAFKARVGVKIGRNDPCPCGSGKKYKKCCLGKPLPPQPG
jgi:hypothetical protein